MTPGSRRVTLEAAFRAAHFRVGLEAFSVTRRIDCIDTDADSALRNAGCRHHWAILTPCNPDARPLSDAENRQRLTALREQLDAFGLLYLPSINSAADDGWPEPGFCMLDADAALVAQLARQYGQLAYVSGELSAAPRLIWVT